MVTSRLGLSLCLWAGMILNMPSEGNRAGSGLPGQRQQRYQHGTESMPSGQGYRGAARCAGSGPGGSRGREGLASSVLGWQKKPFYCKDRRKVHITGKGSACPVTYWARLCSRKWVKMLTLGVQAQSNIIWIVFKNLYDTLMNII